jgi:hypothetical protein
MNYEIRSIMGYFIKLSFKGAESSRERRFVRHNNSQAEQDTYNNKWIKVGADTFHDFFEVAFNAKNAPYHRARFRNNRELAWALVEFAKFLEDQEMFEESY